MNHIPLDTLLRLEEAADWAAISEVAHLSECAECRGALTQLEALAEMRKVMIPDADFEARVAASVRVLRVAEQTVPSASAFRAPRHLKIDWAATGIFVFASITVWLLLLMSSWSTGLDHAHSPSPAGPWVLALLAGGAATWRSLRYSPSLPARS